MATFGRQNNMRRRVVRPDGRNLRIKRRSGLDQAMLLEIAKDGPPRRGVVAKLLHAIAGLFRKR